MTPPFLDHRLLIVTGKGGVGKSSVAAALALASAQSDKRTLVAEVNTKERVTQLLGKPEAGPQVTSVEENLWAVNLRPQEAMREYALMILKFESIYNAVFENRLVQYFLRFVPSLAELVLLGKLLFHLKEKRPDGSWRFDRIVVDAPATGHAITFLSVPQVIIDTVPPGPLSEDAKWMRDFLVDPLITAAVLVSLPEDMPVNETIELSKALETRVHVQKQAVVLNGYIGHRFPPAELSKLEGSRQLHDLARVHEQRARLSDDAGQRLAALGHPLVTVPRLYPERFGRKSIEEIAAHLAPMFGGPTR